MKLPSTTKGLLVLGLTWLIIQAAWASFWLITPEEYAKDQTMDVQTKSIMLHEEKLDALAPKIVLKQPSIMNGKVQSPMKIELTFQAQGDATIDSSSLRVLYGFIGLDITSRILESDAEITESGLVVKDAELPPGVHDVVVEIQDSLQRTGRASFSIEVKG